MFRDSPKYDERRYNGWIMELVSNCMFWLLLDGKVLLLLELHHIMMVIIIFWKGVLDHKHEIE